MLLPSRSIPALVLVTAVVSSATSACGTGDALLGSGALSEAGVSDTGAPGANDASIALELDGAPASPESGATDAAAAPDAVVVFDASADAAPAQCSATFPPPPVTIPCELPDGGAISFVSCDGNQFTCPPGSSPPICVGESDTFLCTDFCGSDVIGQPQCETNGWMCPRTAPFKTTECLSGCPQYPAPDCCDSAGNVVDYTCVGGQSGCGPGACNGGQLQCPAGSTTCACPLIGGTIPYCCATPGATLSFASCAGGTWQCPAPEQNAEVSCCSATVNLGFGSATCTAGGWSCGAGYSPCTDGGP
jgi:hypothetical protein